MAYLSGKSIVVTGAARGLGEAYARLVAAEGASVVLNDIDGDLADEVTAKIRASGGTVVAHNGDVRSWDFAESLIDRCVAEFGRIDGLVNNAGVFLMAPIEDHTEAMFREQIESNLFGHAFCGIHALRRMMAQGSGSVVNTYSGTQVGMAYRCSYSAAMAGIAGLTRSWAHECRNSGVRVNAIAPVANTRELDYGDPILKRLIADGRYSQAAFERRAIYRTMTTDSNAPMVVYFLSDLSAGINGQGIRYVRDELNLMAHAGVRAPSEPLAGALTVEALDALFSGPWKDKLLPLGLVEFDMDEVRALTS